LQYFVYIGGGYSFSPIPIELTDGPSHGSVFLPSIGKGTKGAWFDSGSPIPPALAGWNAAGVNDSRLRLFYVEVSFASNSTVYGVTYPVSFSLGYGVTGGTINASSARSIFQSGVYVNGTLVIFQLPSDEMPRIEGGQLVVDRPFYLACLYSPEFYFSLKTPFGGFEGWVAQNSGPLMASNYGTFSYSAPILAGFLGTQRFTKWTGTINSTSPTLSLSVMEPYEETAYYTTDYGAVASILVAVAAMMIGGYFMLRQRQRLSSAG
jgi:hypothetical protein